RPSLTRSTHTVWLLMRDRMRVVISPFFCTATATTEIYTLSLHDALPILFLIKEKVEKGIDFLNSINMRDVSDMVKCALTALHERSEEHTSELRHVKISYAVFCLKKKN